VYGIRQTAERAFEIQTHTDQRVTQVKAVFTDEHGRLFLETGLGVGVVRSPDMVVAAEAIEAMAWQVSECKFDTLPVRYGYVLCPAPAFKG
jgi:hypothetical protein